MEVIPFNTLTLYADDNTAIFLGYLETAQLLLLWHRIIGYNTLELLPVLAVAVFAFRRNNLMEVRWRKVNKLLITLK